MHTYTLDQALDRCDLGDHKPALVCQYPHKSDIENLTKVIEKSAYDKAVEALKEIAKHKSSYSGESSPEANWAKKTLRELGIE